MHAYGCVDGHDEDHKKLKLRPEYMGSSRNNISYEHTSNCEIHIIF